MGVKRDLISLYDLTADELRDLFARAQELKAARARGDEVRTLSGKVLGTVFEKASTRTRVSFEVGMFELGGHAVYLSQQGTQIGRGEPIQDLARVLGGYTHGIVLRTFGLMRCISAGRDAESVHGSESTSGHTGYKCRNLRPAPEIRFLRRTRKLCCRSL